MEEGVAFFAAIEWAAIVVLDGEIAAVADGRYWLLVTFSGGLMVVEAGQRVLVAEVLYLKIHWFALSLPLSLSAICH